MGILGNVVKGGIIAGALISYGIHVQHRIESSTDYAQQHHLKFSDPQGVEKAKTAASLLGGKWSLGLWRANDMDDKVAKGVDAAGKSIDQARTKTVDTLIKAGHANDKATGNFLEQHYGVNTVAQGYQAGVESRIKHENQPPAAAKITAGNFTVGDGGYSRNGCTFKAGDTYYASKIYPGNDRTTGMGMINFSNEFNHAKNSVCRGVVQVPGEAVESKTAPAAKVGNAGVGAKAATSRVATTFRFKGPSGMG